MAEIKTGRWVPTYGCDIAAGDLVRLNGSEHRVMSRDYPPFTSCVFKVRFPSGPQTIGKLSRVEIWDEDGTVAKRVQTIPEWRRS